jgi:hypothetical protein
MAKFDPQHATVPDTNFGDKNSAERYLECGKFRRCANLKLIPAYVPSVLLYLPLCKESRFNKTGNAEFLPMPVYGAALSPLTYTTVGQWASHISCPRDCKGYRSLRWANLRSWFKPKRTQNEAAAMKDVLSNEWVVGLGVTSLVAFVALVLAWTFDTELKAAEIAFGASFIPTLIAVLIAALRTPPDTGPRNDQTKFPDRGDYSHSATSTHKNPDGSITLEGTASRQIDRRPQLWEAVSNKFGNLPNKPIPIRGEWVYSFETRRYDWTVWYPMDVTVALCIEICKEAGRLLLTEPSFQTQFPDIAAITDEGDRWLTAVHKIAKMGKVTAKLSSASYGVSTTGEGGEIKDLPGASRVLCQIALNGFR